MSRKQKFDHKKIEKKWQSKWEKEKVNRPVDITSGKNSFYNLWMFPYPSAEGLHAGHAFASTGSDVYGRFMRMNGKNVFQPIGYDSFGIHGENFAIKKDTHPAELIKKTTKNYERQMRSLGHGYDWTRTVTTSEPDYYRWTQWMFVQLFKAGLAYRKKAHVNYCPSCKTVLSDEQVMTPAQAGKDPKNARGEKIKLEEGMQVCERCGTLVEKKKLEQWMLRITDYADKLLDNLGKIDWTEKVKTGQRNWIGKSEGAVIKFQIRRHPERVEGSRGGSSRASVSSALQDDDVIKVFTTRPDTLYGATFFILAPGHPDIKYLTTSKYKTKVQKYVEKSLKKIKKKTDSASKEKTGEFTGGYVVNPATKKNIPVYVSDYVSMDYGAGAIMGVPAHDERDFEFADKNDLDIKFVIEPIGRIRKTGKEYEQFVGKGKWNKLVYCANGIGKIISSDKWNGLVVPKDIGKILIDIEKKGWGKRKTNYHLRDWIISRQRYWGTPIPMIFCESCAEKGRGWFTECAHPRGGTQIGCHSGAKQSGAKESQRDPIVKQQASLQDDKLLHSDQSDWKHAGWWPVPEDELPVELPYISDYKPKGEGRGPLDDHPEYYKVDCPHCGADAKRETDVSDTFLDSSWYFLRYPSVNKNSKHEARNPKQSRNSNDQNTKRLEFRNSDLEIPWSSEVTKAWLPVDLYFGGAEHTVLHLMYARFVTMALNDLNYLDFDEPFSKFYAHGLMIKDGAKMSKSRGNVVNPDKYIEKYGADTLRLYLMFMGPMDGYPDFRDTGIEGMRRFIEKVWSLFQGSNRVHPRGGTRTKSRNMSSTSGVSSREISNKSSSTNYLPANATHQALQASQLLTTKMHQTIKKVTEDIQKFHYNTAIAAIMEYVNALRASNSKHETRNMKQITNSKSQLSMKSKISNSESEKPNYQLPTTNYLKALALMLAPFTPHLAEEAYQHLCAGSSKLKAESLRFKSIHQTPWPKFDPKLIKEDVVTIAVQVNGKLRSTVELKAECSKLKEDVIKAAKEDEKVHKWIEGKEIKKEIFVPGKLVNFVVA